MNEFLNDLDVQVFYAINRTLRNPVFDLTMPFLTDLNKHRIVLLLVVVILLWMIVKGDRSIRLAALLLIPTIILSDQLSSTVIKFMFDRLRPCHALPDVHLLVPCGSGYSFPSSHAVNNFAGATVLSYFLPRARWWLFGFASTIGCSRVIVGVHYPSDVVGGGVIGMIVGVCVVWLFRAAELWWFRRTAGGASSRI